MSKNHMDDQAFDGMLM